MYAVISPEKIYLPPGSVMRLPGTWQDYCALRQSRGDSATRVSSFEIMKFC